MLLSLRWFILLISFIEKIKLPFAICLPTKRTYCISQKIVSGLTFRRESFFKATRKTLGNLCWGWCLSLIQIATYQVNTCNVVRNTPVVNVAQVTMNHLSSLITAPSVRVSEDLSFAESCGGKWHARFHWMTSAMAANARGLFEEFLVDLTTICSKEYNNSLVLIIKIIYGLLITKRYIYL